MGNVSTRTLMTRGALKVTDQSLRPKYITKVGGRANVWRIDDPEDEALDGALLSIRTSMGNAVAFKRIDDAWETLDDVNFVAIVSLDAASSPAKITARLVDADTVREAFNRALLAREEAGIATDTFAIQLSPVGRERADKPNTVGNGFASNLDDDRILEIPTTSLADKDWDLDVWAKIRLHEGENDEAPNLIPENAAEEPESDSYDGLISALAAKIGVSSSRVQITILPDLSQE